MSKNIAIVLGEFHKDKLEKMLSAAQKQAAESDLNITKIIWVPGALEKPLALDKLLQHQEIHGAIALGIIERGETKHGLIMGETVTKAIVDLQLKHQKPIGMGIIGPEVFPSQIDPRLESYAKKAIKAVASMFKTIEEIS